MKQLELETKHQQEWTEFELLKTEAWYKNEDKQLWESLWGLKGVKTLALREHQDYERQGLKFGIKKNEAKIVRERARQQKQKYTTKKSVVFVIIKMIKATINKRAL